jgi:hypothetical protein
MTMPGMGSMPSGGGIAPAPQLPERAPVMYERKMAPAIPGNRGPLRFEEGLGTDTDIPNDFQRGMMEGTGTGPGGAGNNPDAQYKHADEVLRERAHPGSASWVDSATCLQPFATGAGEGQVVQYVQDDRSGGRYEYENAAVIQD